MYTHNTQRQLNPRWECNLFDFTFDDNKTEKVFKQKAVCTKEVFNLQAAIQFNTLVKL